MFKLLEEKVVPCAAKNNTVRYESKDFVSKLSNSLINSASGDLGTLAYIAGTLLGLDDIYVWHGTG
jgi:phenylalanine ammonia-lyase